MTPSDPISTAWIQNNRDRILSIGLQINGPGSLNGRGKLPSNPGCWLLIARLGTLLLRSVHYSLPLRKPAQGDAYPTTSNLGLPLTATLVPSVKAPWPDHGQLTICRPNQRESTPRRKGEEGGHGRATHTVNCRAKAPSSSDVRTHSAVKRWWRISGSPDVDPA